MSPLHRADERTGRARRSPQLPAGAIVLITVLGFALDRLLLGRRATATRAARCSRAQDLGAPSGAEVALRNVRARAVPDGAP